MAKLREAEVLLGRGKKVAEVVKELGKGSGLVIQHYASSKNLTIRLTLA